MPKVAIIGAGLIGFGVGANLIKLGEKSIVILEREKMPGLHSTGKSAGGFRAQFSTRPNIEMSMKSIRILTNFKEEVGVQPEIKQYGYMFLATSQAHLDALKQAIVLQREYGVPVEFFEGAHRALEICEQLRADDIIGGTFCPTDGYFDPYDFMLAYADFFLENGGQAKYEAEVIGFETKGNEIEAVRTKAGDFPVEKVVIAAGAWSGEIGKMLGLNVPIVPVRRQVFDTEPFDGMKQEIPLIVDMSTGLYVKSESGGFLLGYSNKDEPPGFNYSVDPEFRMLVAEMALSRFPVLEKATLREGWAGFYDTTPDHHSILGIVPPFENLFIAAGFSGHGAMHSPIATKAVAELIVHGSASCVDISPLAITRFKDGQSPLMEHAVI